MACRKIAREQKLAELICIFGTKTKNCVLVNCEDMNVASLQLKEANSSVKKGACESLLHFLRGNLQPLSSFHERSQNYTS